LLLLTVDIQPCHLPRPEEEEADPDVGEKAEENDI
jgi:hypothetical protein